MTEPFIPNGPYYIEIVFDHETESGVEQVRTGFIDGFQSQHDAWAACEELRRKTAAAISADGSLIKIAPDRVLQLLIAKMADAPFMAVAAE